MERVKRLRACQCLQFFTAQRLKAINLLWDQEEGYCGAGSRNSLFVVERRTVAVKTCCSVNVPVKRSFHHHHHLSSTLHPPQLHPWLPTLLAPSGHHVERERESNKRRWWMRPASTAIQSLPWLTPDPGHMIRSPETRTIPTCLQVTMAGSNWVG